MLDRLTRATGRHKTPHKRATRVGDDPLSKGYDKAVPGSPITLADLPRSKPSMYPTLESRADLLKMLDALTDSRKRILERCQSLSEAQLHDPVYPGTWSVLQNLSHLA